MKLKTSGKVLRHTGMHDALDAAEVAQSASLRNTVVTAGITAAFNAAGGIMVGLALIAAKEKVGARSPAVYKISEKQVAALHAAMEKENSKTVES